ncbi:hypothetical protein AVEN_248786-1 [Araneus ventricosus]|uniref:Uncharacterized protein n=1 Tax=Araneus ventricosus TaxID=182803 RepID=A0A4Y2PSZ2_ARAVE|nr:hypothetical protein AVEN_248786-1 [Araneus ventricosus]
MPPKKRTSFDKSSDAKGTHTKISETEEQNAGDAERKEDESQRGTAQEIQSRLKAAPGKNLVILNPRSDDEDDSPAGTPLYNLLTNIEA